MKNVKNIKYDVEFLGYPPANVLLTNITFDLYSKILSLVLEEDEGLTATRFVMAINDIFDQVKNQNTALRGKDQLALHMRQGKKQIGTIRFGGINLQGHTCNMPPHNSMTGLTVYHNITLAFERYEIDKNEH